MFFTRTSPPSAERASPHQRQTQAEALRVVAQLHAGARMVSGDEVVEHQQPHASTRFAASARRSGASAATTRRAAIGRSAGWTGCEPPTGRHPLMVWP